MKRILSLVFAFTFIFSLSVVPTGAANTFYEAGFDYEKVNGTAKIVNYYGISSDLVIPETLGGLPVTEVADGAISLTADTQIETLSLPSSLTVFSARCILSNTSLKEIKLAEGNTAFSLVDGVLYSAGHTILYLYPAADPRMEYDLLDTTVRVESAAFYGASNLERIGFPQGLRRIESAATNQPGAFEGCTALKRVNVPFSLIVLGDYAFMGCTALEKVFFPDSSKELKIGMGAFLNCPNLKSVRLYSNVKSAIGAEAFGLISAINDGGMMETRPVDGFCMYAVTNTEGAKYAKSAGIALQELRQVGDFSSNSRFYLPKSAFPDKVYLSTTAAAYAEADYADLRTRLFSMTSYSKGWRINRRLAEGNELPEVFDDFGLYSIPAGSLSDFDEKVYLFSVNEQTGDVQYVPSYLGTAPDSWGGDSSQLEFETALPGPFLAFSATPSAGDVDADETIGISDITVLACYLAGYDYEFQYLNSDVDGDAEPTIGDVTALAMYLAGWDVELLPFASKF